MVVVRERESPVLTEVPEEASEEALEQAPEKVKIIHPLDKKVLNLRDGYIPPWSEVAVKLELQDKSRGEKKLFRSFYRAHRMYARRKNVKGKRLMDSLIKKQNFIALEEKYPNELRRLVDMFSKGR